MVRYLDNTEIERLATLTDLPITVHRYNDSQMPSDFETARAPLSGGTPLSIQTLSAQSIAGYALLKDVYSLGIEGPRDIYEQGKISLHYFILSLIVAGLVFGLVTPVLLEKSVLSRLAQLKRKAGD